MTSPQQDPICAGYVPFTYVPSLSDHLTNERHWPPYQPLNNMSQAEMDLRASKGVYEHFHVPWNTSNRYLSSFNKSDLAACRDLPRRTPPPFDTPGMVPASSVRPSTSDGLSGHQGRQSQLADGQQVLRPQTASPSKKQLIKERVRQMEYAEAAKRLMVTQTGVPCYTTSALIGADLEQCAPLESPLPEDDMWRESRVQTYALLPAKSGWAEGGVRPFHQDYRHYKYYGFAGRGAKTSWAHNPKYKHLYQEVIKDAADANPPAIVSGHADPPPLEVSPGVRRPLTPKEKQLVSQFPEHSYAAEPPLSPRRPDAAGSRPASASPRGQRQPPTHGCNPASPSKSPQHYQPHALSSAEVMEPYYEHIDLRDNKPVDPQNSPNKQSPIVAKVVTYRQPCTTALTLTENISPQHGSQSPFHARYAHYKQFGFGGKGATSSWARNPKYAQL